MFVPFEKINAEARIWIYQSNRQFTAEEESKIREIGQEFVNQWTAHKQNLLASFEIINRLFLIVSVDESVNGASGCSIDKSFSFIRQIEHDFSVSLLDRKAVAYEKSEEIELTRLDEFEKLYKKGHLTDDVIVYNNLIQTKRELSNNWRIPLHSSWHMQML